MVEVITACRACSSTSLQPILDFGEMPLANRYLTLDDLAKPEPRFPLSVLLCSNCGLVQLAHTVDPAVLFADYLYATSASGAPASYWESYASDCVQRLALKAGKDFIVGIGGNDGALELAFQDLGFKVLNVESASNIAAMSAIRGVLTVNDWFNEKTAKTIAWAHGHAFLITCNNCFAHMPNVNEAMRAVKALLQPSGVFVCQTPWWLNTVRGGHHDQVYHEHFFYWTVLALASLFDQHGMNIDQVTFDGSQGGSVRVFACRSLIKSGSAYKAVAHEHEAGLFSPSTYVAWTREIEAWRRKCQTLLLQLSSVSCYGVPAKFTMLSEQLGFSPARIAYAVDDNPLKVGRFTPGSRIPIVGRSYFEAHPTEHCVITAANHAERIMAANPQFKGEWILLTPEPKVLE